MSEEQVNSIISVFESQRNSALNQLAYLNADMLILSNHVKSLSEENAKLKAELEETKNTKYEDIVSVKENVDGKI